MFYVLYLLGHGRGAWEGGDVNRYMELLGATTEHGVLHLGLPMSLVYDDNDDDDVHRRCVGYCSDGTRIQIHTQFANMH